MAWREFFNRVFSINEKGGVGCGSVGLAIDILSNFLFGSVGMYCTVRALL